MRRKNTGQGYRGEHEQTSVVVEGARYTVRRPRVCRDQREVELLTLDKLQSQDLLDQQMRQRMVPHFVMAALATRASGGVFFSEIAKRMVYLSLPTTLEEILLPLWVSLQLQAVHSCNRLNQFPIAFKRRISKFDQPEVRPRPPPNAENLIQDLGSRKVRSDPRED